MPSNQYAQALAQLLENSSALVLLFDRQSLQVLHLNETAVRRLGKTQTELDGLCITELIPQINEESLLRILGPSQREHGLLQASLKTPTGESPLMLELLSPSDISESGDGSLVMVMAREISPASAEAALTDNVYRSLVSSSPYCIHQIDLEGRLASIINETDEQCIVGVPYLSAVCDVDKTRIAELLGAAMLGQPSEFEFTGVDGKEFSSNFVPIKGEDGRVQRLLGITIDITQRKQQERALIDSQALLNATGRVAKVGGWRLNALTAELSWTDQTYAIHELPIGQQPPLEEAIDFYHPEDRPAVEAAVSHSLETGEPFEFEQRIITAKGNLRWVHSRGEPEFVDGKLFRLTGIFQDITERKLAEAKLQKMEKLESIGLLAGGIAHDFNNILTTLFGNIELLKRTVEVESSALPLIQNAELALERATNLTKRLLTFSQGGAPVKDGSSIDQLIKEVVKFDLSGSNVLPVFEIAEDLWTTAYDIGQMEQVFSNLTLNAAYAMAQGGHITVGLENCPEAEVPSSLPKHGDYIKITFRDEGCGVERHNLDRIFDPYFTTKEDGQGLGLATTLSIISRHGGNISAQSEPGKGTTFIIYLPVAETPVAAEAPIADSVSTPQEGPTRILVMDDDAMVRDVTATILEQAGHEVDMVEDGERAIAVYKESLGTQAPYDCVIMDLTIPGGMGGLEALENILSIDPDARAIVSSGYAADAIMSDYAAYGFKGCVIKPFSMEQLSETVTRVISQH